MNYKAFSYDLRRDCVDIIMAGGGGHIGGDMSVLNTLLVLYKNHLRITGDVFGIFWMTCRTEQGDRLAIHEVYAPYEKTGEKTS